MRILVVNENISENQEIKKFLQSTDRGKHEFYQTNSIREGYDLLKNNQLNIDLIIIDLNLCDRTCYRLLKKFKERTFELAFLSDEWLIPDFLNVKTPVTYISRPIVATDLRRLSLKVKTTITQDLFSSYNTTDTFKNSNRLALKEDDGIRFVDIDQIRRCKSDNNYTEIYLQTGERILSSKTLKTYELELQPFGFYRVHQSHLVDMKRIKKIVSRDGLFVKLENDQLIELSRRRKEDLIKKMVGLPAGLNF